METNKLQTIKNIEVSLMTKFMMQDPECIPEKYHGSLDEFLSDIRKNKWAELFLNMHPDKVSNNNYWFELQEFFTEKMSSMLEKQEKSKPFVSFTTEEEFMDFLDDYSIFVSLWEKYKLIMMHLLSAGKTRIYFYFTTSARLCLHKKRKKSLRRRAKRSVPLQRTDLRYTAAA